jgi:hypothetical protein
MCSIFYAQESYTLFLSLSLSLSLSSAKKVFASVDGKESLSFFLSFREKCRRREVHIRANHHREKEFIELRLAGRFACETTREVTQRACPRHHRRNRGNAQKERRL